MIPESQADKLLAPIYTHLHRCRNHHPRPRRRHPAHAALLQGERRTRRAARRRARRQLGRGSRRLALLLRGRIAASRSFSTISACARPRSPWPKAAPAAWSPQRITAVPGSSRSFLGGAVVYSDALKTPSPASLPNSSPSTAPSPPKWPKPSPTASACAPAQPWDSASPASPAPPAPPKTSPWARVYIAVSDAQKTDSFKRTFRGDRDRVRQWATQQALDLIRKS